VVHIGLLCSSQDEFCWLESAASAEIDPPDCSNRYFSGGTRTAVADNISTIPPLYSMKGGHRGDRRMVGSENEALSSRERSCEEVLIWLLPFRGKCRWTDTAIEVHSTFLLQEQHSRRRIRRALWGPHEDLIVANTRRELLGHWSIP
jgi:hypothetical protein